MRNWTFLAFAALANWSCGGDSGGNGNGNGNGHHDGGHDGAHDGPTGGPQDGPADAPVDPDASTQCYECNTTAFACLPNQAAAPGCAFGDYRPGDLCEPGVSPCACLALPGDDIGFCTGTCTSDSQCLPYGALCGDFGAPDLYCYWPCTEDLECPPGEFVFPDAGTPDMGTPPDVGTPPDMGLPPDTGPVPDGAEPPPDGPVPPPDGPAPACYECDNDTGIMACHALQSVGAGCAFGMGQPGDTCLATAPGFCQTGVCVRVGTDAVGVCTEPCITAITCTYPAVCADFGTTDYCIYTCTTAGDCPGM